MRASWILILACAACGSSAPPTATPTSSDDDAGWFCFADKHGAGSDCTRSIAQCEQDAATWVASGDPGNPNATTRCAPRGLAYCYSYADEGDEGSREPTTACLISQASCQASATYTKAREGTMTACTATP